MAAGTVKKFIIYKDRMEMTIVFDTGAPGDSLFAIATDYKNRQIKVSVIPVAWEAAEAAGQEGE